MTFLELKKLTKRYEGAEKACVNDVDLAIEEGQIVVLLGPSGCGKTTTLKMMAGLIEPDRGDILLEGRSILTVPPEKRDVSMVFQKPLLFPHMTVEQNIGFGLKMKGVPRPVIRERVEEMLKLVRLEGLASRRANQLSGGQEQRVSLARALVIEPKLLLLDEPLSALDAELRLEMRELIKKINEQLEVTMVFVTHDQQEAVSLADRIALMVDGEVIQYDRSPAFYSRPRSRRAAEFFGWTNFIPAVQNGKVITCSLGEFMFEGLEAHDGPICLTIRPEAAMPCPPGEGYSAVVRKAAFMGTRVDYEIDCLGARLGISLDSNLVFQEGDVINIRLLQNKMWAVRCDGRGVCDNRVVWQTLHAAVPHSADDSADTSPGEASEI